MARSKISKECLESAAEALSLFTDTELREYVTRVYNKAKENKGMTDDQALEQAEKEINEETLKELFEGTKLLVENAAKAQENSANIISGKSDLRSLLIKRITNLGRTLSGYKKAASELLRQITYGGLDQEHWNFMRDKNNGTDILRALDGKTATDKAKTIARAINRYLDARTEGMVNAGAIMLSHIQEDRFFRHIHNDSKMLSGDRSLADSAKSFFQYNAEANKPIWREFIKSKLDLAKTFKYTDAIDLDGNIIDSEANRILDQIFDNITQGINDIFSESKVVNGLEQILKKRRIFFKFKDWESFGQYNEKYGTGDFFSALESDIKGTGSKIGTAQVLGSNPYQAYFDLKKVQQKVSPATSSWLSKGNQWYKTTDIYFQNTMGIRMENPSLANFFGNLRSATAMAKLPLVSIASLSDIAYIASYGARWGMGYWKTFGYALKNSFNLIPNEERAHVAKLFKGLCDSELGYISRFADSNNSTEIMKKASMWFYRLNGLEAFDKGNKVSIMHLMANHLGEMSDTAWTGLNKDLKRQLLKHNISADEWNILRQNTQKKLFTTDNVMQATDEQLKALWEKTDKRLPLSQMRNQLYNKVFSIFDVASENAVLSPGEFEKAWLFRGTAPGSWQGEIMRAFAFFKAYPLAYIDRVIVNGFKDKVGAQAKFAWAMQMSLGTLPLSVLSNYMRYYSMGLDFPDITKMSPSELTKFGAENIFGNLGVYLNIIDARNQNKSLIASQFKTAPLELAGDALAAPIALVTGHPKQAANAFQDAVEHVLPIRTLPGLSPYMEGILKHKPYLQPQQHVIYGYNH